MKASCRSPREAASFFCVASSPKFQLSFWNCSNALLFQTCLLCKNVSQQSQDRVWLFILISVADKSPHEHESQNWRLVGEMLLSCSWITEFVCVAAVKMAPLLSYYMDIWYTWQTDSFQNDISMCHFLLFHKCLIKNIWLYLAFTNGCTLALSQPIACPLISVDVLSMCLPHEKVKK